MKKHLLPSFLRKPQRIEATSDNVPAMDAKQKNGINGPNLKSNSLAYNDGKMYPKKQSCKLPNKRIPKLIFPHANRNVIKVATTPATAVANRVVTAGAVVYDSAQLISKILTTTLIATTTADSLQRGGSCLKESRGFPGSKGLTMRNF